MAYYTRWLGEYGIIHGSWVNMAYYTRWLGEYGLLYTVAG